MSNTDWEDQMEYIILKKKKRTITKTDSFSFDEIGGGGLSIKQDKVRELKETFQRNFIVNEKV